MTISTQAQNTLKVLRDAGILPDATVEALLPAPRRSAAPCQNHKGSALRPEGVCGEPVARVYEAMGDGTWKHSHTWCEKCLATYSDILDPEHNRVKML